MTKTMTAMFALCSMVMLVTGIYGTNPAHADGGPLTPRLVQTKPVNAEIGAYQSRTAIDVKFVQGASCRRLAGGSIVTLGNDDLTGLQAVLAAYPIKAIARLFSQPEVDIEAEKAVIEAATGREMPDLNLWYRFTVAEGTDAAALIDALNALPEVEIAYASPLPAPPPSQGGVTGRAGGSPAALQAATPSFVDRQGYLNAAPSGIDAKYAWTQRGGTGLNVTIVDSEYNFNGGHEDLKETTVVGGVLWDYFGDNHGTAVLGEMVGINNDYGVTGIAYDAAPKFSSPCLNADCSDFSPAEGINNARLATVAGDVILIEQQTGVCGLTAYGPVEWYQATFDAISVAIASGRIVVEAAGNGSVDLDQAGCNGLFKRHIRDSGAIIVGAGAPPGYTQKDRSRLYFSSYGSRVDVQGWGEMVVTTGYGSLYEGDGKNQWYANDFSGTSSASPVVAGAAALLSSIARERGVVQTPAWIRSTLVATGSPQQSAPGYPATMKIGPRPNLKAAIGRLPAAALTVSPRALEFGKVKKDVPSGPRTVTLKNTGSAGTSLAIEGVTVSGPNAAEFTADATKCGKPLARGESCTVSVTLTASSYGSKTASLDIASNDPDKASPVSVKLEGDAGAPKMVVTPVSFQFGAVQAGRSTLRKVTVRNAGLSDLVIDSITLTGDEAFTESNACGTIGHNDSCTITVTFAPEDTGQKSAGLDIVPAYGDPVKVGLRGKGR
jgi:serine protease